MCALRFALLVSFYICSTAGYGQQSLETDSPNLLQGLLQSAEGTHTPLGIILDSRNALCARTNHASLKRLDEYTALLESNGYTVAKLDGVYVVRPTNQDPITTRAIQASLPYFPRLTGRMQFIGMVLQGWLSSILDGAKGFGIDYAVADHRRDLTLPAMGQSSVQKIASTIVNLDDGKGVWILSSVRNPEPAQGTTTHINIFSYVDDSNQISSIPCKVESVAKKK